MEIMAEDWVRLKLGMRLQIGILRYTDKYRKQQRKEKS